MKSVSLNFLMLMLFVFYQRQTMFPELRIYVIHKPGLDGLLSLLEIAAGTLYWNLNEGEAKDSNDGD